MNVSTLFNTIVYFQPNTGERILGDYFGILGFKIKTNSEVNEPIDVSRYKVSIYNPFLDHPEGFKVICVVDNPYRRVISKYKEISHINWALKRHSKEYLSESFNNWIHPIVKNDFLLLESDKNIAEMRYKFMYPYDFDKFTPDASIRLESFREDLYKIDFLDKLQFNFDTYKPYDVSDSYKDVWNYENARVFYKKHKKIFNFYGYDPFSFTTRPLSEKEMVDFIHY